ncbi:MAG TPA: hypothetical protein VF526_20275 [Solirubrobacteraceae bacterium]
MGRLSALRRACNAADIPQLSAQRGQNDPRSYRLALVYETGEISDEALPRAGSIADFALT